MLPLAAWSLLVEEPSRDADTAIKHVHRWAGFSESPTDTLEVETAMRGLRRTIGKAPAETRTLRLLVEACPETLIGLRDRALLLIGFAGAFRRSARVALDVGDVVFRHEGLVVTIRKDTTDQEQAGREIGIPDGSNPTTCPVRTLRQWVDAAQLTDEPLFRSFSKAKGVQHRRIASEDVARIIKRRCRDAGLDPSAYSGHSLRAGFVTSAALAGVQERIIAEQTGHESMRVLRKYIRKGSLFRDNAATNVGL
jgi:integrase